MGQTQYRSTEVAKTLSRFIKADLADDLALALINNKFPGMSREELLRVFGICQDKATIEYERSQEVLASMRETTTGYAALFALVDLWRSQSEAQRRAISDANFDCRDPQQATGAIGNHVDTQGVAATGEPVQPTSNLVRP